LLLLGGNINLQNASNLIGTVAASGVGSLLLTNSAALDIGTVGAVSGLTGNTVLLTAGGAITSGVGVALAANGKVFEYTNESTIYGQALEAAAVDGDIIEVMPMQAMVAIPSGS
jgi:hypothetical protein